MSVLKEIKKQFAKEDKDRKKGCMSFFSLIKEEDDDFNSHLEQLILNDQRIPSAEKSRITKFLKREKAKRLKQ